MRSAAVASDVMPKVKAQYDAPNDCCIIQGNKRSIINNCINAYPIRACAIKSGLPPLTLR